MTDQTVTKKQNTLQSTTRKKTTRKKATRKKVAKTTVSQTAYRKLTRELASVKEENDQLKQQIEELLNDSISLHRVCID